METGWSTSMTSAAIFCGLEDPLPLGFNNTLWSKVRKVDGEEFKVVADGVGGGVVARFVAFVFELDPVTEDRSW